MTAKRELLDLVAKYAPWEQPSDEDQARIDQLKAQVYPHGVPLPRL